MTPYPRPTYATLLNRIAADLSAMPQVLREPLAATWAQACNGLHGHLEWIDAQCSPLTCELERLYDWAALYAVHRLEATAASGNVMVMGVTGAQVLSGTLLRGENGLDYRVLAAITLTGGSPVQLATGLIPVRCMSSGIAGNQLAGQILTLIDPITGVDNRFFANDGLTGGADAEQVNDWRSRVATEWSLLVSRGARSGKPEDFRFWAKSAHPSVSGAIVQPHALGMGTVVVRPICNTLPNRLPTQAVLDAVTAFYTQISPAVTAWRVTAPVLYPVTFTIHLQPAIDTVDMRAVITGALNTLLLSKGGDGINTLAWAEVDTTLALITAQYVLDESSNIAWAGHELPILQDIHWI